VPKPERPWRNDDIAGLRKQLGVPDRRTIVYTGRLHADKGLNDLADAVAIHHREGRPLSLCLVGDGPERDSLVRRAERAGIRDLLVLPGAVPSVEPYLRAADLFVLPSYQEGLSVSLLEALAIGMPCLASDIPANRELVPKEMMPLFSIRDPKAMATAIREQLDAPKPGLAEQRKLIAERFSIEAAAKGQLEVLDAVVQRAAPR
jgi:glycosyltransferase involved in cell wall biosynthesis